MKRSNFRRTLAILTLVAAIPVSAWAFNGAPLNAGRAIGDRPPSPPPQAYAACEGKQAGDKLTITTPRGEQLAATCRQIDGRLAAVPDRTPRCRGRRTPPPQAYSVCQGKQAGASVKITTRRGNTIAATCREVDGRLAAIPAVPPRFGSGQRGRSTNP